MAFNCPPKLIIEFKRNNSQVLLKLFQIKFFFCNHELFESKLFININEKKKKARIAEKEKEREKGTRKNKQNDFL